jgi:hypothetical protein
MSELFQGSGVQLSEGIDVQISEGWDDVMGNEPHVSISEGWDEGIKVVEFEAEKKKTVTFEDEKKKIVETEKKKIRNNLQRNIYAENTRIMNDSKHPDTKSSDPVIDKVLKAAAQDGVQDTQPKIDANAKKVKVTAKMIKDAYKKLDEMIDGEDVNAATIGRICYYAYKIVDNMYDIKKKYKVQIVSNILRAVIDGKVDDESTQEVLYGVVDVTLPLLFSGAEQAKKCLGKLFAKCCSCC